jgi:hypothetical protein
MCREESKMGQPEQSRALSHQCSNCTHAAHGCRCSLTLVLGVREDD